MRRYIIDCVYCGDEFKASRADAKYCSDSCRNMAYLKRKRENEYYAQELGKLERTKQRMDLRQQMYDSATQEAEDFRKNGGSLEEYLRLMDKASADSNKFKVFE